MVSGLPITGAGAGLTATAIILIVRYQDQFNTDQLTLLVPGFMLFLSLCMVSTFKFPKMAKRDGIYINSFQALNFIVSCYCAVTKSYPEFLFFMGIFLLITGTVAGFFVKTTQTE